MTTVANPEAPYLCFCDQCEGALDVWDWNVRFEADDVDAIPRHALCESCLIPRLPTAWQERARARYVGLRETWERVGAPPRTLIGFLGHFSGPADETFPAYFMSLPVTEWDHSPSRLVFAYGGEHRAEGPPLLGVFGAYLTTNWGRGLAWLITWSWWQPDMPSRCELVGWDKPISLDDGQCLMATLNAFRQGRIHRGRPPGTADYTRGDLDRLLVAQFVQNEGVVPKLKDYLSENFIGETTFKKYRKRYKMGTYHQWTQEVLGPRH